MRVFIICLLVLLSVNAVFCYHVADSTSVQRSEPAGLKINPAAQIATGTIWGFGFALGGFAVAAMVPHEEGMAEGLEAVFFVALGHTVGSIAGVNWYGKVKQMRASNLATISGAILGMIGGAMMSDHLENPIPIILGPPVLATLGYNLTKKPRPGSLTVLFINDCRCGLSKSSAIRDVRFYDQLKPDIQINVVTLNF
ncbi:hypothetical protein JW948_07770 [bacterium]|nr:hypothetical protein [bacterium]